jgi:hypothetical protein
MLNYTRQERSLIILMRILAVVFIGLAVIVAIIPDTLLTYFNDIGRGFFGWQAPRVFLGQERFWLMPTISLLIALAYLCLVVQRDPPQYSDFSIPVIIALFSTAAGFGICFGLIEMQFFYLVGAIATGLLFLITLVIYIGSTRSRNRWEC